MKYPGASDCSGCVAWAIIAGVTFSQSFVQRLTTIKYESVYSEMMEASVVATIARGSDVRRLRSAIVTLYIIHRNW